MMGPLIVQSDKTVLLELDHPDAEQARQALATFAELERAPEHVHTYRITRLGLWNAAAAGLTTERVIDVLTRFAKFEVPGSVITMIRDAMGRYGKLVIERDDSGLLLTSTDAYALREVVRAKRVAPFVTDTIDEHAVRVEDWARGALKQALLKIGWPADDRAGYTPGEPYEIELDEHGWQLRTYQRQAVEQFVDEGSGVVVLPCGAGKTLVGAAAMSAISRKTLILVTNSVAVHQWRTELLTRTSLTDDEIGEYSGEQKRIAPVTIATYQILTARKKGEYGHLGVLAAQDWGLIVYDEVHLLPAPIFKLTAELQARRRLGLTATLVREDGKEGDVFSLIGPKRYEAPWRDIEAQGYISPADCFEIRVELTEQERYEYATRPESEHYRFAASASGKLDVVRRIRASRPGDPTLIIGQYLDQLEHVAEELHLPIITGKTPTSVREELFQDFRNGTIGALVVSKVANFSVDLPDAKVAIQISGAYGSRQEEAQRLGRILRPNADGSRSAFFAIVAKDTVDQDFALNRQRFLSEQGYTYEILDADQLPVPAGA